MTDFFKRFARDEDGAVTVDWVVLTAAIVGLGLAVLAAVSGGVGSLGDKVNTTLSNGNIVGNLDNSAITE